jgi:hypothetical protein
MDQGGNMKTIVTVSCLAVALVFGGLGLVRMVGDTTVFAASTFIGSTVLDVDSDGRMVTIRTDKGESLTLAVADPGLIKGVNKGDQVSLELGPDDRVNKVVKVDGVADTSRSGARDTQKGRSSESEY